MGDVYVLILDRIGREDNVALVFSKLDDAMFVYFFFDQFYKYSLTGYWHKTDWSDPTYNARFVIYQKYKQYIGRRCTFQKTSII